MKTKQNARQALASLEKEWEVLNSSQKISILGGNGGSGPRGYWSWVNGEYVYTINAGTLDEVVINFGGDGNGYDIDDIISAMLLSMGMAADHGKVAAMVLGLEIEGVFNTVGKRFGIAGAVFNVADGLGEGDWQDFAQAGLGVVVLGLSGWVAVGAGLVLTGWELYELYNDHAGESGGGS